MRHTFNNPGESPPTDAVSPNSVAIAPASRRYSATSPPDAARNDGPMRRGSINDRTGMLALAADVSSPTTALAASTVGGRRISVRIAPAKSPGGEQPNAAMPGSPLNKVLSKDAPTLLVEEEMGSWVLRPNGSFLRYWDVLMLVTLLFTGLVTPFEVAFLSLSDTEHQTHPMFVINILLECLFAADFIIHFFTPYFDTSLHDYVTDHKRIARHYMKGTFLLDIVTTMPWDVIVAHDAGALRLVRFLRFVKLAKILRALKANKLVDRLKVRFGISTVSIALGTFLFLLLLEAHWMACAWQLTSIMQAAGTDTWVTSTDGPTESVYERYTASLQWSTHIMSLVGGSDIFAVQPVERIVTIICELIASCTYALIIGYTASILTRADEASQSMSAERDDLNRYMEDIQLPLATRMQAREYFDHCSRLYVVGARASRTLKHLPAELRQKIGEHLHSKWFTKVPWLQGGSPLEQLELIEAIADVLEPKAFGPFEKVVREGALATNFYVVTKGMAVSGAAVRIHCASGHFGEEIVMTNGRYTADVHSLTFLYTHQLSKEALYKILNSGCFETARKTVRRATLRMALRREFLQAVKMSKLHRGFLVKLLGRSSVEPDVGIAQPNSAGRDSELSSRSSASATPTRHFGSWLHNSFTQTKKKIRSTRSLLHTGSMVKSRRELSLGKPIERSSSNTVTIKSPQVASGSSFALQDAGSFLGIKSLSSDTQGVTTRRKLERVDSCATVPDSARNPFAFQHQEAGSPISSTVRGSAAEVASACEINAGALFKSTPVAVGSGTEGYGSKLPPITKARTSLVNLDKSVLATEIPSLLMPEAKPEDQAEKLQAIVEGMPLLARIYSRAKLAETLDPASAAALSGTQMITSRLHDPKPLTPALAPKVAQLATIMTSRRHSPRLPSLPRITPVWEEISDSPHVADNSAVVSELAKLRADIASLRQVVQRFPAAQPIHVPASPVKPVSVPQVSQVVVTGVQGSMFPSSRAGWTALILLGGTQILTFILVIVLVAQRL